MSLKRRTLYRGTDKLGGGIFTDDTGTPAKINPNFKKKTGVNVVALVNRF